MYYEKVKALCDEQEITIQECEKRAGLANGTIGGWLNFGPSEPKITSLQAVAKVLNVPITDLLEGAPSNIKS